MIGRLRRFGKFGKNLEVGTEVVTTDKELNSKNRKYPNLHFFLSIFLSEQREANNGPIFSKHKIAIKMILVVYIEERKRIQSILFPNGP